MATAPTLPSGISFASLERTGAITPAQANPIRRAYQHILAAGPSTKDRDFAKHAVTFMGASRAVGESAVFGAGLGLLNAMLPGGLDARIPFVKAKHTVPMDGIAAGLGILLATGVANHESGISGTVISAAASCSTIYGFRKVNDLVIALKESRSGIVAGGGAAGIPGRIGKAQFAGEDTSTREQGRRAWGSAHMPKGGGSDIGADPLIALAAGLK